MKKKLLPICAMALLTVGYSSVASADTGTVTKEEVVQQQQDKAKKEEEKKQAAQAQEKSDIAQIGNSFFFISFLSFYTFYITSHRMYH